jgi:periplasmic divalent cation tolerance protein
MASSAPFDPASPDLEPVVLVLTNLPDRESALALANGLVGARLAACANVLAECTSVYRWKGAMETASEVPVLIKTRAVLYPDVEAFIRGHHPYSVPEVIAVTLQHGLCAYLQWVVDETRLEAPRSMKTES